MLIGIDGNEANVEERVGVNVYAHELLWAIYKLSDEWKDQHKFIVYLKKEPKNLPRETFYWQYKIISGESLWIIRKLMPNLLLGKTKPDIFFSPSHYLPPFSFMPKICSIMDLGYLEFSEQFRKRDFWQLKIWSAWSIIISKRIISISESTKRDIVRHYPFSLKKIRVTLLAYDKERFNDSISPSDVRRVKLKYKTGDEYVLFMSTLKPSKNVEGILDAWKSIESKFPKMKLVIAGRKGWLFASIFKKVKDLDIKDRVVFTGFVDEGDKAGFIKGAKVFILPSFWEGFGLDVLNAMACGVAVVVSDRGSLQEVVGKAGVVIDPNNTSEIAEATENVLRMDKKGYNKLVKKGLERVKMFSWEETARETLRIFEELE